MIDQQAVQQEFIFDLRYYIEREGLKPYFQMSNRVSAEVDDKLSTVEALAAKAQWLTPESRVELFNTIQKQLPAYRTYVMLAILGGYDSTPEEKQQLIKDMTPFFTKEGGLPLFERLNKREQTLYRRYLFPERKENMEEKLKG